jgi:hypothetical protein
MKSRMGFHSGTFRCIVLLVAIVGMVPAAHFNGMIIKWRSLPLKEVNP